MFKKMKNNKGQSLINTAITYCMILVFLAVSLDLIFFLVKQNAVTNQASYISNIMMIQGGLIGDEKGDFKGNDKISSEANQLRYSFLTNKEIIDKTKDLFRSVGIKDDQWKITVNNKTLYDKGQPYYNNKAKVRYRDIGEFVITYENKWIFSGGKSWILTEGQLQNSDKTISITTKYISDYYNRPN